MIAGSASTASRCRCTHRPADPDRVSGFRLHWAIAALILLDFAFALSFSQFNPRDALYLPLHAWISYAGIALVGRQARVSQRPQSTRDPGVRTMAR